MVWEFSLLSKIIWLLKMVLTRDVVQSLNLIQGLNNFLISPRSKGKYGKSLVIYWFR